MLEMTMMSHYPLMGPWVPGTQLIANQWRPAGDTQSYFGSSICLSELGNQAVVGASGVGSNKGAVFVLDITQTSISQSIRFDDTEWNGSQGGGIVNGNSDLSILAVSAYSHPPSNAGAIFIYTKQAGVYIKTAKILPPVAVVNGYFGSFAAMDKQATVVVSGNRVENNQKGAVYVFKRDGSGNWPQSQKISYPGVTANANFGYCTALTNDGEFLGVTTYVPSLYLYKNNAGTYELHQTIELPSNFAMFQLTTFSSDKQYLFVSSRYVVPHGKVVVYKLSEATGLYEFIDEITYEGPVASNSDFGSFMKPTHDGRGVIIGSNLAPPNAGVFYYEINESQTYDLKWSIAAAQSQSAEISEDKKYWLLGQPGYSSISLYN